MCKRVNRGRAVDRTVRHRVALEGHPPNLFVCVKTILEYCWKYALEAIINRLLLYFLVHDNRLLSMLKLY